MTTRLVLVLGMLVATLALAAKPFPVPWQIITDPITLSGQVGFQTPPGTGRL